MKYYGDLLMLQCFSKQDVIGLVGNELAAKSLLYNYKQKGLIEPIKHNLYVVMGLDTKQPVASRYTIGSHITENAYISYHSAFEYYGCANQVFFEVYVSGNKKFSQFTYNDITYVYMAPKITIGVDTQEHIRVTSLERTVADSIDQLERVSGLEELLQCIQLVPYIDEYKLLDYLYKYGKQVLFQKVGYILEHFKHQLRLSNEFFMLCKKEIQDSIRYLYKEVQQSDNIYNKDWQLYVPKDLVSITSQGGMLDEQV